jgi:rubrerythrin
MPKEKIMEHGQYRKILTDAIQSEIDSQKFYHDAAEAVGSGQLRDMFYGFVAEEKKHEEILENFLSMAPEALPFDEKRDYQVSRTTQTPEVSPAMKPADAFALAMKKEEEAMETYTRLAEGCTDDGQKNVFLRLASMEREHKLKMEKAFVDAGFPEAW